MKSKSSGAPMHSTTQGGENITNKERRNQAKCTCPCYWYYCSCVMTKSNFKYIEQRVFFFS